MKKKTCFLAGVFIVLLSSCLILLPSQGYAIENDECMECHSDDSLKRNESEGMKEDLFIDYNRFKFSVHNVNGIACVDCHADIEELNYENVKSVMKRRERHTWTVCIKRQAAKG